MPVRKESVHCLYYQVAFLLHALKSFLSAAFQTGWAPEGVVGVGTALRKLRSFRSSQELGKYVNIQSLNSCQQSMEDVEA